MVSSIATFLFRGLNPGFYLAVKSDVSLEQSPPEVNVSF